MFQYLLSVFSLKKLTHKGISFFSLWNSACHFDKTTTLTRGTRICDSTIGRYSRVAGAQVMHTTIGSFSSIAGNTLLGPGQHPTNYLTAHRAFYKGNEWHPEWKGDVVFDENKRIFVGSDVWIGRNCIIMDGVSIGDGAIIAAGAVVTKDVPPFAIAGGVPAKVLKLRFTQEIVDRLMEIQWWNLPDEEITKRIDLFHKADPTLEDINQYFA